MHFLTYQSPGEMLNKMTLQGEKARDLSNWD